MGCDIHVFLLKKTVNPQNRSEIVTLPVNIYAGDSGMRSVVPYFTSTCPYFRSYVAFAFIGYGGRYDLSPKIRPIAPDRGRFPLPKETLAMMEHWNNARREYKDSNGEPIEVSNIWNTYYAEPSGYHSHTWFTSKELKKAKSFLKSIKGRCRQYDLDPDWEYNSICWAVDTLDRWGHLLIELEALDDEDVDKNDYIFCVCWDS